MCFSSDPAVGSSIFVGAEREELIRNDPDKSEFMFYHHVLPQFTTCCGFCAGELGNRL